MSQTKYQALANYYADKYGIPQPLYSSLIKKESDWISTAYSPKGAIGLAQLMPKTAQSLGVDPYDPRQNLEGGAKFLGDLYKKYGNWRDALSHYNAGFNLTAGRGYADSVIAGSAGLGGVASDLGKRPGDAEVEKSAGVESVVPDAEKTEDGFLLVQFKKYALWLLAILLIVLGIWKLVK